MPLDGAPSPGQDVIARVAAAFGIPTEQVTSRRRDVPTVRARWACFVIMRDRLQWKFARIAAHFDGQDHSSVRHGIHRATVEIADDGIYRQRVADIAATVESEGPPPPRPNVNALDMIVIERLTWVTRNQLIARLNANTGAFRAKYAKTYKRVREAIV